MELIRIYFELLNLVPMPFQAAVFILITALIVYWGLKLSIYLLVIVGKIGMKVAEWGTKLLLLPEYLLTSLLRLVHVNYVPGAGVYDDIVEAVGGWLFQAFEKLTRIESKDWHFPGGWIVLAMVAVVALWYLAISPDMQGTLTQSYIFSAFNQYYSLQQWALGFSAQ